jgi:hypothetical protein
VLQPGLSERERLVRFHHAIQGSSLTPENGLEMTEDAGRDALHGLWRYERTWQRECYFPSQAS